MKRLFKDKVRINIEEKEINQFINMEVASEIKCYSERVTGEQRGRFFC